MTEGAAGHAAAMLPGTDAHGSAVGMPQLVFETFPNQIFWLLVTLVVIYLVLSRVAIPRIGSVLAERAGVITNDIATAEELKLKAREAEAAYTKALADAKAEAAKIIAATKADIQADLDKALAKADAEIAARTAESEARITEIRAGAEAAVNEVARDVAAEIVASFGAPADAAAIDAAVSTRMKG
ncbi:F0F1 ATP synthase subunit B' [Frigidibacter sp. MR17.24]|uniref:F0F1 ATP synthase subunit B' n=1 Tax=Frigidibacter sp. MR17.24 TaxID=3127345 RepID=UPI00301301C2